MLNEIHPSFWNRYPTVQLAQMYLRAVIYNQWQTFLKGYIHSSSQRWQFGLNRYQQYLTGQIEREIARKIRENVGFLEKKRGRCILTPDPITLKTDQKKRKRVISKINLL